MSLSDSSYKKCCVCTLPLTEQDPDPDFCAWCQLNRPLDVAWHRKARERREEFHGLTGHPEGVKRIYRGEDVNNVYPILTFPDHPINPRPESWWSRTSRILIMKALTLLMRYFAALLAEEHKNGHPNCQDGLGRKPSTQEGRQDRPKD